MSAQLTTGVLYVHSAPKALCPHIEWAIAGLLRRTRIRLEWSDQPASHGAVRADVAWRGVAGTGAAIASTLRGWSHLRFEVTEAASPGVDGGRWCYTPELGIWHGVMDAAGNTVVTEDRLRSAITPDTTHADIAHALDLMLGAAWDDELEVFRTAGEGAPIRWLHDVG